MATVEVNPELKKFARDAATNTKVAEDAQEKVVFFNEVATKGAGGFDDACQRVNELATKLNSDDSSSVDEAPAQLLEEFENLNKGLAVATDAFDALILFVQYRYPQMKHEDNLGVEIVHELSKKFNDFLSIIEGGGKGGGDEKGGSGGSYGRFCSVRAKYSYIKSRCELEKSLKQPANKDKEDTPPAGPSNKLLLKQLDVDTARDVARTWTLLKRMAIQSSLLVGRNFKNLNQPRKESSGFIG